MLRAILLCTLASCCLAYTAPPAIKLGDFLIQRAIQQQLYYSAQLRNEPIVDWLKRFKGHEHLDSKTRREVSEAVKARRDPEQSDETRMVSGTSFAHSTPCATLCFTKFFFNLSLRRSSLGQLRLPRHL